MLQRNALPGLVAGFAAAATIIGTAALGPGPVRPLRILGAVIGVAALPLAFWPFITLRRHGGTKPGGSYMDTTRVVEAGLYKTVRHPQYLAYILWMAAFSLLAQRILVTSLAAFAAAFFYLSAVAEERDCSERLGRPYDDFLQRVPRFNLLAGILRRLSRRG